MDSTTDIDSRIYDAIDRLDYTGVCRLLNVGVAGLDYNRYLKRACLIGSLKLVQLMIWHGADAWNVALRAVIFTKPPAHGNDRDAIIKYILAMCDMPSVLNTVHYASTMDAADIVRMCLDANRASVDEILYELCTMRYVAGIHMILSEPGWRARVCVTNDLSRCLRVLCSIPGIRATLELLLSLGATSVSSSLNDGLGIACFSGILENVEYLLECGAQDYTHGLSMTIASIYYLTDTRVPVRILKLLLPKCHGVLRPHNLKLCRGVDFSRADIVEMYLTGVDRETLEIIIAGSRSNHVIDSYLENKGYALYVLRRWLSDEDMIEASIGHYL